MTKEIRQPVRILPKHWQAYLELFGKGIGIRPATREVQLRFSLPIAHSREAVRQKCITQGVNYPRDRKGPAAGSMRPKHDSYPTDETAKVLEEAMGDIERYRTERFTEALKKLNMQTLIELIRMGEKYPSMEKRAVEAERGYYNMLESKKAKEREEQRQKEQQAATRLAVQQGDISTPLG